MGLSQLYDQKAFAWDDGNIGVGRRWLVSGDL